MEEERVHGYNEKENVERCKALSKGFQQHGSHPRTCPPACGNLLHAQGLRILTNRQMSRLRQKPHSPFPVEGFVLPLANRAWRLFTSTGSRGILFSVLLLSFFHCPKKKKKKEALEYKAVSGHLIDAQYFQHTTGIQCWWTLETRTNTQAQPRLFRHVPHNASAAKCFVEWKWTLLT